MSKDQGLLEIQLISQIVQEVQLIDLGHLLTRRRGKAGLIRLPRGEGLGILQAHSPRKINCSHLDLYRIRGECGEGVRNYAQQSSRTKRDLVASAPHVF
jgi:hypothetical protein